MPAIPGWSACLLLMLSLAAEGKPRLPAILSDHAVLQRSSRTAVWGWAAAGEKVAVQYAGQENETVADADGRWRVELDLSGVPEGQAVLKVRSGAESTEVRDVLAGDVWLSSGQSNMQFTLNATDDGWEEIGRSAESRLRWFMAEPGSRFEGPREDVRGTWRVAGPETSGDCGGVPYYFGKTLCRDMGTPVGLILTAVGGSTIQSWMSPAALDGQPELKAEKERILGEIRAEGGAKRKKKDGIPPQEIPSFYYNQIIHPLREVSLKGVIWYQGESHFNQEAMYARAFPGLIRDWRAAFGRTELPFHFCQLPNIEKKSTDPGDAGWIAGMRGAQGQALAEPATGMVVLIDAGGEDFHPKNKRIVGERLAWQVEDGAYGRKTGKAAYPSLASHEKPMNGRVVIHFSSCEGGLLAAPLPKEDIRASGGIPDSVVQGFALRGADGRWHWARAEIRGGEVEVWSPDVADPEEIRYAWSNNPTCNLSNRAGLPAAPFRIDLTAR